MPRIDTFFKPKGFQLNQRKEFRVRSEINVPNQLTNGMMSSPKRKLQSENIQHHLEGSPSKRQRKFTENLSYWRGMEGEGASGSICNMPRPVSKL